MSRLLAFSAFDAKLGIYNPPFYMQHTGQALRTWEEWVNDGESPMSKYPADFQLFQVGEYSQDQGVFSNSTPPVLVGTALEYKKKSEETGLKAVR